MDTNIPISQIMTRDLITVPPKTTLKEVYGLFERHSFHHLPVIDEGSKLLGIISREDFYKAAYNLSLHTGGKTFSKLEYGGKCAKDIMTAQPLTLDPDDSVGLAADIFLANKFHSVPIVEDDQLIGIVTTHDLLEFTFDSKIVEKENV
jgi:acetoin utilization protein AcuB